jgi:REP element-mobilizing transposase RayT
LVPRVHKEELHRYITGLVRNRDAKLLAVHCLPDHTHLFVGFRPVLSISDFIKEIKVESNEFINKKGWTTGRFAWQEGYGVFSYAHSQIESVVNYINDQETRHRKVTFREEYHTLLNHFEISYDDRYLFEFLADVQEAPSEPAYHSAVFQGDSFRIGGDD